MTPVCQQDPDNSFNICWRETTEASKEGKGTKWTGKQQKEIDSKSYAATTEALTKMGWNFEASREEVKALEDTNEIPQSCADCIDEAWDVQTR